MYIVKIVLFNTILISTHSFALSCAIANYSIYHTTELSPNSVFWLRENISDAKPNQLYLEANDEKIILNPKNTSNDPSFYMLKPNKNLTANKTYTLNLNDAFDYRFDNVQQFTVTSASSLPTPKWEILPQLTNMQYEKDDGYGGNGSLTFKYKINIPTDKHLIRVNYKSILGGHEYNNDIVQPTHGSNDESEFKLGFDGCLSGNDFRFKPWQVILMKFDLILDNGEITPWQGPSIVYIIRKKHDKALNYSKDTDITTTSMPTWYERFMRWLSVVFKFES